MSEFDLLAVLGPLPAAHDPEAAARAAARLLDAARSEDDPSVAAGVAALLERDAGNRLIAAIGGNSPFLAQCLAREPAFLIELATTPPDRLLDHIFADLPPPQAEETAIMAALRLAKRRTALLTGIADMGGLWPLHKVTGALSRLAETATQLAVRHMLLRLAAAGDIRLRDRGDPARGSGLCVFGMGKLGAAELNYSSDIDLIVLYDQEVVRYTGRKDPQDAFVRLVRGMVRILQERTADGYVFRTDLRLRPDPTVMPVAISMEAAENYYESLGQNWERAALIKARCIAGDMAAGQSFLERIAPFIWRKNLDFAAIDDIHSIKRQIHAARGHAEVTVPGHNIKVGRGGIREIEFFAQTQQLILGGRIRSLRAPATCAALLTLVREGRPARRVAGELIAAYEFLRKLEHRLQMIEDEQTQTLPVDRARLRHVATFMGYDDVAAFETDLRGVLERVQGHYARLFETAPELGSGGGSLVFTGTEDDPETLNTLRAMGYEDVSMVAGRVRGWHHGRIRATRSARARELLTALMPHLLRALAHTASPDDAFRRFDEFLEKLPTGVQLFSLFYNNPNLLEVVAEIMGSAPLLAERLSRNAGLFDAVITNDIMQPLPDRKALAADLKAYLKTARDYQDVLDFTRRFANDRRFMAGVQALRRAIDIRGQGVALSDIADAVLGNLLDAVGAEFSKAHGKVKGGGMAILGLGKLGAREMTFGSDLDLIFVYDNPAGAEQSGGKSPLPVSVYFARLSQRIINALTAMTGEGVLYEVDMRLRPSGNKGPVAVHLDGMAEYQRKEAWTWEHMALTRARVLAGPKPLARRIETLLREVLTAPRDPVKLLVDVVEMHNRLTREHGDTGLWNIKHAKGGLVDAEFITQYHLLLNAAAHPAILTGNTVDAFRNLGKAGVLAPPLAARLAEDAQFMSTLQGLLRLCYDTRRGQTDFPPGLRRLLAKAGGVDDFADLEDKLGAVQKRVAKSYHTLVEAVAAPHLGASPPES